MSKIFRIFVFVAALSVFLVLNSVTLAARPSLRERLAKFGGTPCPNSIFTCVTLTVPLDHFNPSDPRTMDVVFAVLPSGGESKGMFVTVTGGPGSAGISYADSYLSYNVPEIPEKFDIVFFDQRGVGLSGGMDCYRAVSKLYQTSTHMKTPNRVTKYKAASEKFANDCDTKMGHPEFLPYLSTYQAVEDLELFRQIFGGEKFWIYGESYGTQYAQTYAHVYPEHLAGMILDGTVDLTPDGIEYYELAAQAFSKTLVDSLAQCEMDARCAADFGKKPLKAYDQLAEKLAPKKLKFQFPLGNGTTPTRKFGYDDLDTIGVGQMYGETGRMFMVRALAKYARDGDIIPLARLLYPNLAIDETTLKPSYDPSYSDAYYYGVECQDYGYYTGTPEERADAYVAAAMPVENSGLRIKSLIWGDLPCVYWRDSLQDTTRPPYWTAPGVPTLVLNAINDPITPVQGARNVYEHLEDGYLILQEGGPHVIWERGVPCIDDPVNNFLTDDVLPAQRETICPGQVMTDYVPLAPANAGDFKSPLEAMESTETEINYLPEFWDWDYETPTGVGCGANGTLHFSMDGDIVKFVLDDCAFTEGFEMTGNGSYDSSSDRFKLTVQVEGEVSCRLVYQRVGAQSNLKGDCSGLDVDANGQTENGISPERKPERVVPGPHRVRQHSQ